MMMLMLLRLALAAKLVVTLLLLLTTVATETSPPQQDPLIGQESKLADAYAAAPWRQQVTDLRSQQHHHHHQLQQLQQRASLPLDGTRNLKLLNKRQSTDQLMPAASNDVQDGSNSNNNNNNNNYNPSNSRSSFWRQHQTSQISNSTNNHPQLRRSPEISLVSDNTTPVPATTTSVSSSGGSQAASASDICSDRLCYGLPMGCLDRMRNKTQTTIVGALRQPSNVNSIGNGKSLCSVLVTSKHLIDPYRPVARDIHFELVALPVAGQSNYAAVGFSDSGRMAGLVSECLQYKDANTKLQIITLAHSYNIPGVYSNVPVTILSGIKNLGVSFENGYYQCRWVVESAVEFTYEDLSGQMVNKREDLGYKNYHVLLASGAYNERTNTKSIHADRVSSSAPISLAQTGLITSLGSHIFVRIHGSLMVFIWIGLVTFSIIMARYYKDDTAAWFVIHRAFMLIAWFGSIFSVVFAYMYTETYHPVNSTPGLHQISGCTCLILSTVQVLAGLMRPSLGSSKRIYFNWLHFSCGNLGYLCAMSSIVTAAFLAPAHLPPIYMWIVAAFVIVYALVHLIMTTHQYIVHKSSKISITPSGDQSENSADTSYSYSTFKQVMLGVVATVIVIFIVLLISLINMK